jgi:ferulate-5-hydroxylase
MRDDLAYIPFLLPVFIALLVWYLLRLRTRSKIALPYPPGPKGYPLIGNLLDFPLGVPLWEGLADMARQRGGILPLHELSQLDR